MSAIAKHLIREGFEVSGSDAAENEETATLCKLGAAVYHGHSPANVAGADVVVYNSAIKEDNPELSAARMSGVEVLGRMDFLRRISSGYEKTVGIAGCHGKTTATAMLAGILAADGRGFFSHIGGEDVNLGNYHYSGKEIFLTEVCEFARNIEKMPVEYACLLNVGFDHADCYRDIEDLKAAYFSYLDRAKVRIVNADDEYIKTYTGNVLGFGMGANACCRAENLRIENALPVFDLCLNGKRACVRLNAAGVHNVYNALAAALAAHALKTPFSSIVSGLEAFSGLKRRFEHIGTFHGAEVICDYAHHPDEIRAAIAAARALGKGEPVVVFQPHTYTRTAALMDGFVSALSQAAEVYIYKTFAAREEYSEKGSAKALFSSLPAARGYFDNEEELYEGLKGKIKAGDVLLVLGAGDIYYTVKKMVS